jgi:FkbM family methyltransferase
MKKLVFDIGANVGRTAEFYASRSEKTICFEPNPNLVNTLNESAKFCIDCRHSLIH